MISTLEFGSNNVLGPTDTVTVWPSLYAPPTGPGVMVTVGVPAAAALPDGPSSCLVTAIKSAAVPRSSPPAGVEWMRKDSAVMSPIRSR